MHKLTTQAPTIHATARTDRPNTSSATNKSTSQGPTAYLLLTTKKPTNYPTMHKLTSQAQTLHTTARTNRVTTSSATKSTTQAPTHHTILMSQRPVNHTTIQKQRSGAPTLHTSHGHPTTVRITTHQATVTTHSTTHHTDFTSGSIMDTCVDTLPYCKAKNSEIQALYCSDSDIRNLCKRTCGYCGEYDFIQFQCYMRYTFIQQHTLHWLLTNVSVVQHSTESPCMLVQVSI